MQVATVVVDPPQAGEVRIKIVATALCHTGGRNCCHQGQQRVLSYLFMSPVVADG